MVRDETRREHCEDRVLICNRNAVSTQGVGLHTGPGYTYKVQGKNNEDEMKQIKYS